MAAARLQLVIVIIITNISIISINVSFPCAWLAFIVLTQLLFPPTTQLGDNAVRTVCANCLSVCRITQAVVDGF